MNRTPSPTPSEVSGQRMVAARKAIGLTQTQLADLLGVDQTTISRLELGKVTYPQLNTIGDYCRAVDCDPIHIIEPYFEPFAATRPSGRRRPQLAAAS